MARSKKKKTQSHDEQIEEIVEVEIEYICPKRGKVKQKVKMKKLKPVKVDYLNQITINDGLADLDGQNDDFSKSSLDYEDEELD